jgi:hypothetical protein
MSRVEWAALSAILFGLSLWVGSFDGFLPSFASGLIGFAGGWTLAWKVLP